MAAELGIVSKPKTLLAEELLRETPLPRQRLQEKRDARRHEASPGWRSWQLFPTAQQIREFISTLKEGAKEAGVRYALAEVQRQELTESMDSTPWAPIAWEKQFDLFNSAEKFDNPYSDLPGGCVVPGLVMHCPERATIGGGASMIQSHRSLIPDSFLKATSPEWTPAELNPRAKEEELQPAPKKEMDRDDDVAAAEKPRVVNAGERRANFSNDNEVETAMIRIFDFTAESGKRYRYRVRAVLFNPNYNRPDVLDPDDAMKPFLVGDWSGPSEEVYVEPTTEAMLAENKTSQTDALFYGLPLAGSRGKLGECGLRHLCRASDRIGPQQAN